jgi:hypothetical protein
VSSGVSTAIDCLVLTPVGPRSQPAFVADTIASFRHYMPESSTAMVVLDDSRSSAMRRAIPDFANVHWLTATDLVPTSGCDHNTRGILLLKQLRALEVISRDLDWQCLLRLDDDALFIGPSPHRDALAYFTEYPTIGMLGAYLRRGDGSDKRPSLAKQRRRLVRQILSGDGLRRPRMSWFLARLFLRAASRGYKLGHMCTGGALFLSRAAYDGFQPLWQRGGALLRGSRLADDLLLAVLAGAAGFGLADFSDADQIMAINWRGLPMPLDELVRRKKKLVHPVKDPADPAHEAAVRAFFRARRTSTI